MELWPHRARLSTKWDPVQMCLVLLTDAAVSIGCVATVIDQMHDIPAPHVYMCCVCMWCVCMSVCMCGLCVSVVCLCVGQRLILGVLLDLPLNLELFQLARQASPQTPEILLFLSRMLRSQVPAAMPGPFCVCIWARGDQSQCLHAKHFADWTISPASQDGLLC